MKIGELAAGQFPQGQGGSALAGRASVGRRGRSKRPRETPVFWSVSEGPEPGAVGEGPRRDATLNGVTEVREAVERRAYGGGNGQWCQTSTWESLAGVKYVYYRYWVMLQNAIFRAASCPVGMWHFVISSDLIRMTPTAHRHSNGRRRRRDAANPRLKQPSAPSLRQRGGLDGASPCRGKTAPLTALKDTVLPIKFFQFFTDVVFCSIWLAMCIY